MGNFEIKKCKSFDHCELLRALISKINPPDLEKVLKILFRITKRLFFLKITIAGQRVFAIFGTKYSTVAIYTKHSASNAEKLNLHHEKHELLIIHTVFL